MVALQLSTHVADRNRAHLGTELAIVRLLQTEVQIVQCEQRGLLSYVCDGSIAIDRIRCHPTFRTSREQLWLVNIIHGHAIQSCIIY